MTHSFTSKLPAEGNPGSRCRVVFHRIRTVFIRGALLGLVSGLGAQTEVEAKSSAIEITMPDSGLLRVETSVNGCESNWIPTKLVEEKDTGVNGKQFVFAFEGGAKLTLTRNLQKTPTSLSGEDSWTLDQGVVGFLCFRMGIPWLSLDGISISTDFGEVTANELTGVSQLTVFLNQRAVQQFTLKNAAGNSFTMSFTQPCQFAVHSNPQNAGGKGGITIFAFWTPPFRQLAGGEFAWKIEANSAGKK